jgi:hypothetical protein
MFWYIIDPYIFAVWKAFFVGFPLAYFAVALHWESKRDKQEI